MKKSLLILITLTFLLTGCETKTNENNKIDASYPNHRIIYTYMNFSDNNKQYVGIINSDGTAKKEVNVEMYNPQYKDGYIYGILGNEVVKFKADFKDKATIKTTKITNLGESWLAESFYYYNGNTYYKKNNTNASDEIFATMAMTNGKETIINNYIPGSYYADADGFYEVPMNANTGNVIFKYNLSGKNKKAFDTGRVLRMTVTKDWIFYTNNSDNNSLYKIDKDGNNKTKLVNVSLLYDNNGSNQLTGETYFDLIDEDLYYINKVDGNKLYKVDITTKETEVVLDKAISRIWVKDKYIYYQESNSLKIMAYNIESKTEKEILSTYVSDIIVIDN